MGPRECPQPFCVLQRDGLGREELAEMLVRLLCGERISDLRPSPPRESRAICVSCAKQIMDDRGPLSWGQEFEDVVAGWRSYRRARRRRNR